MVRASSSSVVTIGLVCSLVYGSLALDFGGYLRRSNHGGAAAASHDEVPQSPVAIHPLRDPQRRALLDQGIDQSRREELSKGREQLIHILTNAGATYMSLDDIRHLPTWSQVSSLYGEEPIIYGLETCRAYRDRLQYYNRTDSKPRVAGLFNTGTNAVAQSMSDNYQPVEDVKVSCVVLTNE